MTAPIGTTSSLAHGGDSRGIAASHGVPSPRGAAIDRAAETRWTTAPALRATGDHLALVQALIEAGQCNRAVELLDAIWHHEIADERAWYLRLWVLAGQGRVLEALELARHAAALLPGSAAIAYLQAALERTGGDPDSAVEAALRSAAIHPGRVEPEALLELILRADQAPRDDAVADAARGTAEATPPLPDTPFSPLAAALAGLALLHPPESGRAFRPSSLPHEARTREEPGHAVERRRFWLIGVATVVAALWAVRDPLPATVMLAGVVAWLSRPPRRSR